jgi:hypothetical protein
LARHVAPALVQDEALRRAGAREDLDLRLAGGLREQAIALARDREGEAGQLAAVDAARA